jgi:hypothetical protein
VTLLYLILDQDKAVEEVKPGHFTNNYMSQAWPSFIATPHRVEYALQCLHQLVTCLLGFITFSWKFMETSINVAELTNRGQKVGRKRGLWLIFLRSCFRGIKTPT